MKSFFNIQGRHDELEVLRRQALDVLSPQFKCTAAAVRMGNTIHQEDIDRERALCKEYRTRLKTQPDRKVVSAYKWWIGDYERRIREAQKALDKKDRLAKISVKLPKLN